MKLQIILEKSEEKVTNLLIAQEIINITKHGSIEGEAVDAKKVAKLILCETKTKFECDFFTDNQNQKAIECLKEIRKYIYYDYEYCEELLGKKTLTKYGEGCLDIDKIYIDYIDNKIKELEGNNDKAR